MDSLRLRFCASLDRPVRYAMALGRAGIGFGVLVSCAGAIGSGGNDVPVVTTRYTLVTHETCSLTGEEVVREDANGDGKADVITVSEGGIKLCQWLDFNFDGVCDTWVYFTAKGQVRRREVDYDRDGRIDETTNFLANKIQERQRATTLAGKVDTWQYFENGRMTRAERDTNGDGVVDQWWEYPKALVAGCPLIHSDMDGDGRPEPGATVDLCAKDADQSESDEGFDNFEAPLSETVEDGHEAERNSEPTQGSGSPKPQKPTDGAK